MPHDHRSIPPAATDTTPAPAPSAGCPRGRRADTRATPSPHPAGQPISYAELGRAVRDIAGGLAALGIERGDHVAILAGTRPEWTLADLGALCAGATVVPIYQTNSPEECEYILAHAGVRAVFCEDADQVAKIEQVRERCPALEHVIVFDGTAPGAVTLAALRAGGAETGDAVVAERLAGVGPRDVATIVYTSGTTGPPKGCVVSHYNLLATVAMYVRELELRDRQMVIYLFLPLAHSLARVAQLATLEAGGTLAFWGGDPARIVDELAEIRPTHFPSVPRIYEKVHAAVLNGVAEQRRVKRALFRWALGEGARARAAAHEGTPLGRLAAARHRLADTLVLSKVRALFGDRLAMALCGAAPVAPEVLEFFDACGVLVLEGYGMTETCAAATLNTPRAVRFGSVGRPLAGTEVAIADDGEILMAGPHVFSGYHRNREATSDVLDGRWLRSGDLGEVDEDGYLHITGRKKDLIITSSGKNISPENLESALRETPLDLPGGGDRRPPLLPRRPADARPRRGAEARGGARHPGRPGEHGGRRTGPRGVQQRTSTRSTPGSRGSSRSSASTSSSATSRRRRASSRPRSRSSGP